MKLGVKIIIIILVILILFWLITQPKKSVVINVLWIPPYPNSLKNEPGYTPGISDREQIVYGVYYVWGGKRQELPWWIIMRLDDFNWRVIEAANSDNYKISSKYNSIFDKNWIDRGFNRVQRTRLQIIQHILFGTEHDFGIEKKALFKIYKLIEIQGKYEKNDEDLFDSMKQYLNKNPEMGIFCTPDRDFYDEDFKKIEEEYKNSIK